MRIKTRALLMVLLVASVTLMLSPTVFALHRAIGEDGGGGGTFPPTVCADDADCDGCFSACQDSYAHCRATCHDPLSRECESQCNQRENDCFEQAMGSCI
jgi:hypothetical protein